MLTYNRDSPTPAGDDLNHEQLAQARAYSYSLFGRLFLEGITADSVSYLEALPALAEALPQPLDLDEAASAHYSLFSFGVFPYATLFVEEDGLLGGKVTSAVQQLYQQTEFQPDLTSVAADHLGHELGFLAFLTGREQGDHLLFWRQKQHHFLTVYLLPWFIPCMVAIREANDPFFAQVARLTLAMVLEHHADLASQFAAGNMAASNDMPEPTLLEDEKTGLRDITRFLVTPSQSGLFLSSHEIGRLGRELELPRGFGKREQILLNLLRTAVQYEMLPDLLQALTAVLDRWQAQYTALAAEFEKAAVFIQPWQTRLTHTRQLLTSMNQQL